MHVSHPSQSLTSPPHLPPPHTHLNKQPPNPQQAHPPLALALLNVSFFSVWTALCPSYPHGDDGALDAYPLVPPLETALRCPGLPPGVLNRLLTLAEFMELREKPLPIGACMRACVRVCLGGDTHACMHMHTLTPTHDHTKITTTITTTHPTPTPTPPTPTQTDMRLLGQQAERAQAYAKCLKYKEREFHADPSPDCVEVSEGGRRGGWMDGWMDGWAHRSLSPVIPPHLNLASSIPIYLTPHHPHPQALISVYSQLGLRDSAIGILRHSEALLLAHRKSKPAALSPPSPTKTTETGRIDGRVGGTNPTKTTRTQQQQPPVVGGALRPSWLEKIHQWEKALALYEAYVGAVEAEQEELEQEHEHEPRGRRVSSSSSSSASASGGAGVHRHYSITSSVSGRRWTINEEQHDEPPHARGRAKAASVAASTMPLHVLGAAAAAPGGRPSSLSSPVRPRQGGRIDEHCEEEEEEG